MQIYIDESGNLGTGGRYFVITCLIPHDPKRIKNLVKRCCVDFADHTGPLKELKGSRMDFTQKQDFVSRLTTRGDFFHSYIIADKTKIIPKLIADQNIFFNYLTNLLLKPIIKTAKEDIEVILDNRSVKVASGNVLRDYLKTKAFFEWGYRNDLKLCYVDSKQYKITQAVDIIANTVYQNYDRNLGHCYGILSKNLRTSMRFPHATFGT